MKKTIGLLLCIFITAGAAAPSVNAANIYIADTNEESEVPKTEYCEQDIEPKYDSFSERLQSEVFGIDKTEDTRLKTMDGNTYTEYVYISSAADLRAIDGHDGGYYEIMNDITLTDADFKPIKLTNAVVNGKGHWIYGLKQSGEDATGLFAWDTSSSAPKDSIYVANLNLSDVNINSTGSGDTLYAGALGGYAVTAENCYVSGRLTAVPSGAGTAYIIGMSNGINSQARLDITVSGSTTKDVYVAGMADCKNCAMEGDIRVTGTHHKWDVFGAAYCVNTKVKDFIGDISVSGTAYGCDVRALSDCEKLDFTGDMDINANGETNRNETISAVGMLRCTECNINGNFDVRSSAPSSVYLPPFVDLILGGDKCTVKGSVNVANTSSSGGSFYFIYGANNSSFEGSMRYDIKGTDTLNTLDINGIGDKIRPDINYKNNTVKCNLSGTGYAGFCGIAYSDNSTYIGNVSVSHSVIGISGSCNNCALYGNLHSRGVNDCGFNGISNNCKNCTIYGSLSSASSEARGSTSRGIYYCENCSIYGNLTSAATGVQALDECKNCYVSGTASGVKKANIASGYWKKYKSYPVFVSSAVPYQGVFRCSKCGEETVSAVDMTNLTHCIDNNDNENRYQKQVEMQYEINSRNDKDSENNYINYVPEPDPVDYTIEIVRLEDGKPLADAKVSVDGDDFTTDSEGLCKVKGGKAAEAAVAVEYGGAIIYKNLLFNPVPNTKNTIKVCDFNVEFDGGGSQQTVTEGPKGELNGTEFPIFDLNSSFDIGLPGKVKVSYDENRKAYRILFGDLGKITDLENIADKEFEDKYKEISKLYQQALAGKLDAEKIMKLNKTKKRSIAVPATGSASGFMELQKVKIDGKEQIKATGGLIFTAKANASGSTPFAPFPLLYFSYGIEGTIEGGINLSLVGTNTSDMRIEPSARLTLMVSPWAGLGLGVKKIASAEAGVKGTIRGDLTLPFESLEKSYAAKLSASAYATVNLLGFDATWSHTFVKWPIFPELGKLEFVPLEALAEENMTPVDRSYLINSASDGREGTFKSNIYPYSKVCYTPINNGELMVWLDDDPTRADADRTALYFSKKANNVWSEPKQVNNDGTADFDFALYRYSGDVYLVWQNATQKLPGTDPTDTAKKTDIYMSVLKNYSYDWSEPVAVTSGNSDYEYSPQVINTSEGAYVMWKQNDKNTPIPSLDGVKETVYRAFIKRDTNNVDSVETPLEDTPLVLECIFTSGREIAYIADKDGDPDTAGNVFGITGSGVVYDNGTDIHSLSRDDNYSGEFYFAEGQKLIKATKASSTEIFTADTEIRSIDVIGDSDNKTALYETENGFGSDIYALYYTNDNGWSKNPLLLKQFDEKLRSWDAFTTYKSSKINFAGVLADVSLEKDYSNSEKELSVDNKLKQTVRLANMPLTPNQDISAAFISTDDTIVRGSTVLLDLGITNDTMYDFYSVNVNVTDDKGSSLYSGSVSGNVTAGETSIINVPVHLPDDFGKGTITAEISVNDLEESDTENNKVSETFGGADMYVDLRGAAMRKTGEISILAQNIGTLDATDVKVEVTDENGSLIYSENIGKVESGEKIKIKTPISDSLVKSKDDVTLTARISCGEEELYDYNNTCTAVIEPLEENQGGTDGEFIYGDVDCDKSVTASDATFVLQKTLLDTIALPIQAKTDDWMKYTDVDCDGYITASDAANILQKTLLDTYKFAAEK